jgi:alcohol dehydrogenase (cytochrome c)
VLLTGDLNGDVIAFDAATGKILHRISTRQPVGGGVVTYQAGGKQFVGVAAGLVDAIMQSKGQPAVIVFGL